MMLLIAFTTLSSGRAAPLQHFKITPLTENQPVYFDPVGNMQLIHDEWKLLVYYNLTTFWQSTTRVEEFVNHLGQLCDTMPNEPCHSTLQQLKFEMNQLKEFQIMKTMNDVNAGALTASLLISVLRRNQEMLLSALTDIYRGHLDMKLLPPEQLSQQLNYIAGIIPKRLTLPIRDTNNSNIKNIYKIIYVKARLTEQYLLFELHIPLLSDDEYTLYRNIAIPRWETAAQCQVIQTVTQYIGVNFVKSTYIQMEEVDLQQCTTMSADNHICHASTTINNLHGATASCEAKILNQNVNNVTCDWVSQQCADQWIKLQRPNIWLYNCINECTIRIVCENRITTTSVTKAGLLALGQDCILQHKDNTIYSHNVFSSSTNIRINLEVPTIDSPNDMWSTLRNTKIVLPKLNLSNDHKLLDDQITAQKGRESLPDGLSVHDIGNYAISSVLVGGIVAAIIVWRIRRYLQARKQSATVANKAQERTEDIELKEMPAYAKLRGGRSENNRSQLPAIGTRFKL
ncbi:hypothetical protein HW555_011716 [Spodoptera exigua]|uniref:Envelope protein n=1 Tax=Spodoptera exigua TaxID=7107 RepID=A0A835G740_SPOEX|nr:hypothetical protein HW555_011716 [Spodoptera exigua]